MTVGPSRDTSSAAGRRAHRLPAAAQHLRSRHARRRRGERCCAIPKRRGGVPRRPRARGRARRPSCRAATARRGRSTPNGRLVTPGLVDCHTHMIFAGHRADELQRRLAGEDYAAIAAARRRHPRDRDAPPPVEREDTLEKISPTGSSAGARTAAPRVEVKSGYGLSRKAEIAAARADARRRACACRCACIAPRWCCTRCPTSTATGARHTSRSGASARCRRSGAAIWRARWTRSAIRWRSRVDECRRVLDAREATGLRGDAARRPARAQRRRAARGRAGRAFGRSPRAARPTRTGRRWRPAGTVGVLLPAAALTLRPAAARGRDAAAQPARAWAIATDFNPGTAPAQSLLECAALAARLCGFDAEETLRAITWNAAQGARRRARGRAPDARRVGRRGGAGSARRSKSCRTGCPPCGRTACSCAARTWRCRPSSAACGRERRWPRSDAQDPRPPHGTPKVRPARTEADMPAAGRMRSEFLRRPPPRSDRGADRRRSRRCPGVTSARSRDGRRSQPLGAHVRRRARAGGRGRVPRGRGRRTAASTSIATRGQHPRMGATDVRAVRARRGRDARRLRGAGAHGAGSGSARSSASRCSCTRPRRRARTA